MEFLKNSNIRHIENLFNFTCSKHEQGVTIPSKKLKKGEKKFPLLSIYANPDSWILYLSLVGGEVVHRKCIC
jgi:hypothetical protein